MSKTTKNPTKKKSTKTKVASAPSFPDYTKLETTIFLDGIGRTIIASKSDKQSAGTLTVFGPAILNVVPGQSPGEMGIQMIPLLFPDMSVNVDERAEFSYKLDNITLTTYKLAEDLVENYKQTLKPRGSIIVPPNAGQVAPPVAAPTQQGGQPEVKAIF